MMNVLDFRSWTFFSVYLQRCCTPLAAQRESATSASFDTS